MSVLKNFEGIDFEDSAEASQILGTILAVGSDRFSDGLARELGRTANPSRTLRRLRQYLDGCAHPAEEISLAVREARYLEMLCTLFDQSQFLTDIVCNDTTVLHWAWSTIGLHVERDEAAITAAYLAELGDGISFEERCGAMRRVHRRETLRIALRDIFVHAPIRAITRELAHLADAMIGAALDAATCALAPRFGEARLESDGDRRAGFVVLGMGKLGGYELNFSSDIDLIFMYSEEGETSGDEVISNVEYFSKLGELLIKALTDDTTEGRVYRVDMRLRPHGRMGPLAQSLGSTVDYFEQHGRPWERQALIKARPVGGDAALGEAFLSETRSFVYPKYFDDATLEDIRDTKAQMEAQVARRGERDREVKLGRGGIRDVEFTVQMLQLLNGGRHEALRARNTLDAIDALGRQGLLRPFDAQTLASNYSYLREIEHRLQIEGSQQRHALPTDPDALDDLAKRLGYESGEAFLRRFHERGKQTRAILDGFFAEEGSGHLWVSDLLNPESSGVDGLERLQAMGFADPKGAREELLDLYLGPDGRPHTGRIRQSFRQAAPALLEQIAVAPRPDAVLLRMGRILENMRATGPMYDLLGRNPQLCATLVNVISNSAYLADMVIRSPELFDFFGQAGALDDEVSVGALETELETLRDAHEPEAAVYRLHRSHTLRTGLREILGIADVETVGRELSDLAEVCLRQVLGECVAEVSERYGAAAVEFAVLALGKLGGRELGYGSDLDVIFAYRGTGGGATISAGEYGAAIAALLMKRMKEITPFGSLYEVDARLRPDGAKGPLCVSAARFAEYYEHEAQAWERLALVKARFVAGDETFGKEIEGVALDRAFARPLSEDELAHSEELRCRLAEKSGALDLKRSEGGIAEIEFAVRMVQVRFAGEFPDLRRGDLLGALRVAETHGLFSPEESATLREGYLGLRRVENRIRMFEGRPSSSLPGDVGDRDELALRLEMEGDLLELVGRWKDGVHGVFREVLERVRGG